MSATKNEIIKDLNYCKESLDRIIKHTDKYYDGNYYNHHTVIQADIIKLRRELNDINKKFAWEYGRRE